MDAARQSESTRLRIRNCKSEIPHSEEMAGWKTKPRTFLTHLSRVMNKRVQLSAIDCPPRSHPLSRTLTTRRRNFYWPPEKGL